MPGTVTSNADAPAEPRAVRLRQLAWLFLKLGSIAFGGPAAHIAMMEDEVVRRRKWMTRERFLDLLGATNLPGAVKTGFLGFVAVGALAASLLGVNELAVLFAGGIAVAFWRWAMERRHAGVSAFIPLLGTAAATAPAAAGVTFGLWPLFLVFLKIGSVLFGSGYVLLAFLRADLVERLGWLTEAQLLDAVAVGQMTPGPLFTTATFIGYVLAGGIGALVATVGIFLPAFFFVALSGPLVPRIRRSPTAGAVLDGVNVASLALMAAVTISLARAAIVDVPTAILAILAAVLLLRFRINSAWLVLGGGGAGIASAYMLGRAAP